MHQWFLFGGFQGKMLRYIHVYSCILLYIHVVQLQNCHTSSAVPRHYGPRSYAKWMDLLRWLKLWKYNYIKLQKEDGWRIWKKYAWISRWCVFLLQWDSISFGESVWFLDFPTHPCKPARHPNCCSFQSARSLRWDSFRIGENFQPTSERVMFEKCNALELQTTFLFNGRKWWNNHFSCKDLVHHPIETTI